MEKERSSKERAMEAAIENFKMDQDECWTYINCRFSINPKLKMKRTKVAFNQVVIDYLYAFEKYRSMLI